ncbi:PTS sugar transporter subunit IIA [Tepidanaerobacter sp. GT38]|uniref:PTS sugar transporter subunit IIA n=1 Tax=Tepidanaerobacter sp. GT38 TaxID=2722793 RepID=UPI001F46C0DC|nr:PTS sugar transporter subunit IIA [Tepidanaerobacter sp. GT38]MCG1013233.1 PTS sugar transporter subunit IIA [Tepidanaerobacter sp. GT38]
MNKIIISTHGNLARELVNTARLFASTDNVIAVGLYPDTELMKYKSELEKLISDVKDTNILILTDIFGGTPFNVITQICKNLKLKTKVEIISGVNLPMLLEVLLRKDSVQDICELKQIAYNVGKNSIRDFFGELNESN